MQDRAPGHRPPLAISWLAGEHQQQHSGRIGPALPGGDLLQVWGLEESPWGKGNREKHPLYPPCSWGHSRAPHPSAGAAGGRGAPFPIQTGHMQHHVSQAGCENASPTPEHPLLHPARGGSRPLPGMGAQGMGSGAAPGRLLGAAGGSKVLAGAVPGAGGGCHKQESEAGRKSRGKAFNLLHHDSFGPRSTGQLWPCPRGGRHRATTPLVQWPGRPGAQSRADGWS